MEGVGKVRDDKVADGPGRPAGVHHGCPQAGCGQAALFLVVADGAEEGGACAAHLPESHGVAVGLVVGGHERKRVVGYGTGKLDVGLNTPVPVVRLKSRVIEEVSALEAAHVVVAFFASVGQATSFHLLHGPTSGVAFSLTHPRRPAPHVRRNLLKGDVARHLLSQCANEAWIPGHVVEEDDRIVELAVELALDAADGCDGAVEILVARQHDNCGILARAVPGSIVLVLAAAGKGRVKRRARSGYVKGANVEENLEDTSQHDED